MEADNCLIIWTVYDNPADYPGQFVARKWLVQQAPIATGELVTGATLQSVRDQLPSGLHCLPRTIMDDARIVECWL